MEIISYGFGACIFAAIWLNSVYQVRKYINVYIKCTLSWAGAPVLCYLVAAFASCVGDALIV